MAYHIYHYQFIPYYASAIHKHTHTRILKPFEDSEPTGLKVDISTGATVTYLREAAGVEHLVVAALGELRPEDDVVSDGTWTQPRQRGHEADTAVVEQVSLLPLHLPDDG